eukprot:1185486-Alexandrium_andersonii.AAC.1
MGGGTGAAPAAVTPMPGSLSEDGRTEKRARRCIPPFCCWLFAVASLVGKGWSFGASWGLEAMSQCRISLR